MQRVFIIHGWGANPKSEWFPWLKRELTKRGIKAYVLKMPKTDTPVIKTWVATLSKAVKKADKNTFFVGHSIGCSTILRYLPTLPAGTKVGGVVLVAPWVTLLPAGIPSKEEKKIAKPWLKTKIEWKKNLAHTKRFVAIFSDNDPCVPLKDSKVFAKNLKAKIIVEHNKGHFCKEDKATKVPAALKELLKMMR
jgi:predicted alpha/beta hydrolase family esterase